VTESLDPEVLIIGAGPAGLSAAARLAPRVQGEVLVLEREGRAGGIPRHSNHLGYGVRDLHRLLGGPAYARRLVELAAAAGATIRTESMVTGWASDGRAEVTSAQGRLQIAARTIILATGARERPRAARLVPGDRPRGVYTTGHLQNLVHLRHGSPGRRAVVVGAEPVSWSAVLTLRAAGCRTVLMTTERPSPESYAVFNLAGRLALRTPLAVRTRVIAVLGQRRVEAVEVEDLDTGVRGTVACDAVIFTGDWIPDHELARSAGLGLDPVSRSPLVDSALRTTRPGLFAAGNLLHPVDTADVAALDGHHVADQVLTWLDGVRPAGEPVRVRAERPFRWVCPGLLRPGDPAPARGRLLLWSDELVRWPQISIRQGGAEIARRRLPWPASPGRIFRIPSALLDQVDHRAGDVTVALR
jgi:thioredoxin reductase